MICIVDTGLSNAKSVQNVLKKIGFESIITSNKNDLKKAKKLILPGVGNFDEGVKQLHYLKLVDCLNNLVIHKKIPILGICLGMQLFFKQSEEGVLHGLNWIEGEVLKFPDNQKVPHMGWNDVSVTKRNELIKSNNKFYFVHSFYVECDEEYIISKTTYNNNFVSAVKYNNIYGVQFHPEKSHKYGFDILRNFINECL